MEYSIFGDDIEIMNSGFYRKYMDIDGNYLYKFEFNYE